MITEILVVTKISLITTTIGFITVITIITEKLVLTKYLSIYSNNFSNYFQDTVDVLLGWHFEMSQPRSVTECAGRALTLLAPYWVQDLKFTYTLLNDFLEDIVSTKLLLFNPRNRKMRSRVRKMSTSKTNQVPTKLTK